VFVRAGDIGVIVVDEIHMVGEAFRGALLETLLSKVVLLNKHAKPQGGIQILGMSATLPNPETVRFIASALFLGICLPPPCWGAFVGT
jgi:POLQ-like helicase